MNKQIVDLAEAISQQGVKALFGVPGSGLSLQLITALERKNIPFYGTCHEAAGAIMAGAFGRQTGTLGCSISIKGPGLVNMLAGILANYYEHLPTLSISEAFGPGTPPFHMHKRLDHDAATAFCTKAYATLDNPQTTLSRLATCAREEIPGPVHLDLFSEDAPTFLSHVSKDSWNGSSDQERSGLMRVVAQSARPVVIVGGLATRAGWGLRLSRLPIPVFTTLAAKGVIDETLPFAAGVFTGEGKALSPEAQLLAEADLVVGLGLRNLEVLKAQPFSCPLVIVDVVGPRTGVGFEPRYILRAQTDEDFDSILELLGAKAWGEEVLAESAARARHHLTRDGWLPGNLFVLLEQELPEVGCFVADTGFFCTVAEHVWRARSARAFFASSNGRFMGTGLPTVIGATLADPTRPTICAVGDGGVRMYLGDLKLMVEEGLPILVLLLSDGRYGSIAGVPSAKGLSTRAVTLARPSWFSAIEALGCPAVQVKDLDCFLSALRKWEWRSGPLFVEAVFEPERYAAMIEGIR